MVRIAGWLVALASSLSAIAQVAAPPPANAPLQTQLKSALLARWQALERGDFQTYAAFFDDSFMMVADDGSVLTKASLVKQAREDQQAGIKQHNSDPVEIRVWSTAELATLSYKTTTTTPFAGQKIVNDERVLETFALRNRKWILLSQAGVAIPNRNRQPAQVDASKFDAYVGQYETAPGSVVKVWREGNRLFDQWPGDQRMRDLPLSDSVFYQQGRPGLLYFVRDESGAVTGFQLWIGDSSIVARKVR
jgi:hypothetical protein